MSEAAPLGFSHTNRRKTTAQRPKDKAESQSNLKLTDGDDDAGAVFDIVNVEDALEAQLLEVEPVALVVVSRHRLGVEVDLEIE